MKIVGKLQGACFIRFTPEEILPEQGGVQIPALVSLITTTYQLTQTENPFQPFGAVQGQIPPLVFINGQYTIDDQPISIKQIAFANNGLSINTQDTDAADKITDHFFTLLNTNLKFRFDKLERKYFSSLVVQFERDLEGSIKQLGEIQHVIQGALGRKSADEVALKRLGFGSNVPRVHLQVNVDNVDEVDFVIERRAGQPFSENRYFSAAALRTEKLVAALEQIEKLLLEAAR